MRQAASLQVTSGRHDTRNENRHPPTDDDTKNVLPCPAAFDASELFAYQVYRHHSRNTVCSCFLVALSGIRLAAWNQRRNHSPCIALTWTPIMPAVRLSRRSVLGRLGLVGVGTIAASSLLSACDNNRGNGSSSGDGGSDHALDNSIKGATAATKAANQQVLRRCRSATRATSRTPSAVSSARPRRVTIKNADWHVVWDLEELQEIHRRSTSRRPTRSTRACGATRSSTCSTACSR